MNDITINLCPSVLSPPIRGKYAAKLLTQKGDIMMRYYVADDLQQIYEHLTGKCFLFPALIGLDLIGVYVYDEFITVEEFYSSDLPVDVETIIYCLHS